MLSPSFAQRAAPAKARPRRRCSASSRAPTAGCPSGAQVVAYFKALDAASAAGRRCSTLGTTTLGRPFIAAFIGDPATLANLAARTETHPARLADPRLDARRRSAPRSSATARSSSSSRRASTPPRSAGILTPLVLAAPAGDGRGRRVARDPPQHADDPGAVAQPRRRGHRGRLVPQRRSARVAEGSGAAVALPPLHGPRQQPRLVRLHAGRDADGDRLAVQRRGTRRSSTTSTSREPNGVAHLHPAVHGSGRAEHRSRSSIAGVDADGQVDDLAHDAAGLHRDREQHVVRRVDAGARVPALPRRHPHPHRDGERAARIADPHQLRLAARRLQRAIPG